MSHGQAHEATTKTVQLQAATSSGRTPIP